MNLFFMEYVSFINLRALKDVVHNAYAVQAWFKWKAVSIIRNII